MTVMSSDNNCEHAWTNKEHGVFLSHIYNNIVYFLSFICSV